MISYPIHPGVSPSLRGGNLYRKGRVFRVLIAVWILVVLSLAACTKEEPTFAEPVVTILEPVSGAVYQVYDTVPLRVRIVHQQPVLKITVTITDKNLKTLVAAPPVENINAPDYELNSFMVIDNKYINEPDNYLHIEVEDSRQLYNFWYDIKLSPLERVLSSYLIVTGEGMSNNLYRMEPEGNYERLFSWSSEYLGGFADSRNGLFYTSGSLMKGIMAYSLTTKELLWEIEPQSTGSIPWFQAVGCDEGRVSAGVQGSHVESFDSRGMRTMKSVAIQGASYKAVVNIGSYVLAIAEYFNGSPDQLIVFNYPAGIQYHRQDLPGDFVRMIKYDDASLLLIVSSEGENKSYIFDIPDKQLNYYHRVDDGTMQSITGEAGNFFITTDETIKWYRPNIASMVDYPGIASAAAVAYNPLDSRVYVGKDHQFSIYQLPLVTPVVTVTLPEPIKDIQLLYNK